jgi:hypothetical protein
MARVARNVGVEVILKRSVQRSDVPSIAWLDDLVTLVMVTDDSKSA